MRVVNATYRGRFTLRDEENLLPCYRIVVVCTAVSQVGMNAFFVCSKMSDF